MDSKRNENIEETVRRFAAGDRSPEVLGRLNSAAFEYFHAPWETPKKAVEIGLPGISQGRLPMPGDGDDSQTDSETEDLQIPSIIRQNRPFQVDPPLPLTEGGDGEWNDPLAQLAEALSTLGCLPFLAPDLGVATGLPFDPRADNKSYLTFRTLPQMGSLQMISRGDAALSGLSEVDLGQICQSFNRQNPGVEANTFRAHEAARLRLMLTTTIPFELTRSPKALEARLAEVFQQDRNFWRLVHRRRPL